MPKEQFVAHQDGSQHSPEAPRRRLTLVDKDASALPLNEAEEGIAQFMQEEEKRNRPPLAIIKDEVKKLRKKEDQAKANVEAVQRKMAGTSQNQQRKFETLKSDIKSLAAEERRAAQREKDERIEHIKNVMRGKTWEGGDLNENSEKERKQLIGGALGAKEDSGVIDTSEREKTTTLQEPLPEKAQKESPFSASPTPRQESRKERLLNANLHRLEEALEYVSPGITELALRTDIPGKLKLWWRTRSSDPLRRDINTWRDELLARAEQSERPTFDRFEDEESQVARQATQEAAETTHGEEHSRWDEVAETATDRAFFSKKGYWQAREHVEEEAQKHARELDMTNMTKKKKKKTGFWSWFSNEE
jgi:hypothetical protein